MAKGNRNKALKPAQKTQQKIISAVQQQIKTEQFQGPIPSPKILAGYEQLLPGAADRILTMAEKEENHRHAMDKMSLTAETDGLKNEANDTKRGQYCGLIIGITAILAGTYTSVNGFPWAGSFIGAGGVIGLVSAFIVGRKNSNENQDTKKATPVPEKNNINPE